MDSTDMAPFERSLNYPLSMSCSQQLNIDVDDPNNNITICKTKFLSNDLNANLLLSTDFNQLNSTSKSVIVKHESGRIHRPVPTDQENFFANNPSILLNSANSTSDASQIASHPRIAFRRISAPANLLSSQLNALNNLNKFANGLAPLTNHFSTLKFDDSSKLAEILLRQQLSRQTQLIKTVGVTSPNKHVQLPNKTTMQRKNFNTKRRNSEPVNCRSKNRDGQIHFLWEFLLYLLSDQKYAQYICWLDEKKRIFKLLDSRAVSNLWGLYKGKSGMNYETMARALRYYYQKSLLRKINGRLVYQFVNLNDKHSE